MQTDTAAEPESPSIYASLAAHQQEEEWIARDTIRVLQEWAERFNVTFKLEVPEFVLCVDWLRCNKYGHFRYGHNGFGLRGEIAINKRYLPASHPPTTKYRSREQWAVLGTVLHELLHGWQQAHGTPGKGNYHNAEFRSKALSFGLLIDQRGYAQYAPGSAFTRVLAEHGVQVPPLDVPIVETRLVGTSNLKKWTCGCTNVRCAIASFYAQCLKCGQIFQEQK
jgi:hypothetical protein